MFQEVNLKCPGFTSRNNLADGFEGADYGTPREGKASKDWGRHWLQLEAFQLPKLQPDPNNSPPKDSPQNPENCLFPYLHEKIHPREGKTHLSPYFKMITANLR